MTWAPAAAGLAIMVSGHDVDWARALHRDPPVFGNPRKADVQSDRFRLAADVLWVASMLATDSGNQPLRNKSKGMLVQIAAVNSTYLVTNRLKFRVDRAEPGKPPDEVEGDAFPSNHATGAFAHATLIRENMRRTSLPAAVANGFVAGGYVAATGSAWGRIEAGAHHVSDQLIGAAIGNFMASFINNAFLGNSAMLGVGYAPQGTWRVELSVGF